LQNLRSQSRDSSQRIRLHKATSVRCGTIRIWSVERLLTCAGLVALFLAGALRAQRAEPLVDSPGFIMRANGPAADSFDLAEPEVAPTDSSADLDPREYGVSHRVIKPEWRVQRLTSAQKFELSMRSRIGLGAFGSVLFGAGQRHLKNSRPHYGTDSGAFGERLGAAELKQVTESFFSYGLYASMFHEDPHYYVLGRRHRIFDRAIYAATRSVITLTDSGEHSVNWSKLAGQASATALTNAYYPPQDRGFGESVSSFGSNMASTVLTNEIHEFAGDIFGRFRHKK